MTTRRPDAPTNMMQDDDAPPASGLSSMQRAILTIQKMRTKIEHLERVRIEPIAIIGMGCRFPGGANTPEAFFKLLEDGVDAIREVPAERWGIEPAGSDGEGENPALRWGSFLDDVDGFDAGFFGISPREAESLDPQQRLLLEVAWEALERAGQLPERLMGSRTGVFVGVWALDYQQRVLALSQEKLDAYCFTGNVLSTAAGRISYSFGLQGPCMTVETACSSSLTAIHLACQSLRNGESNLALAGGVNLMLSPATTKLLSKTQALSPDGRCKAFDSRANGFVRGEGCGILVLKRLSDAERDGDSVIALIRGSAVNQDGRSTGLTAPNVLSQQVLLKQALENARVAPSDIGYVEAHGTGTSLGDPIEVEALKAVLGAPREKGSVCVLGAVKTNIGHLETAAGVAGVIKVALALQNERIPANLHFRTLNPRIDLRGTALEIAQEEVPWRSGIRPRFAGVSGFGISGTNAHVVLEEAPRNLEEAIGKEASAYLLPISAKTQEALAAHVRAYQKMLSSADAPRLVDIVYTASSRRSHFEHRLAAVGGTKEELASSLDRFLRSEALSLVAQGKATPARAKVVFVFSGQGKQWVGVGKKLYEEESAFRSVIDSCDALLMSRLGWSLLDELDAPEHMSRLGETSVAQPLIFSIQIALVELLRSWGIAPDAVIGHGLGEIAAAHIAGILSLDEAVRLVAIRGRVSQKAAGLGKMVSVAAPPDVARKAIAGLDDRVAIAAVNDPGSCVLSGERAALDDVVAKLEREGFASSPISNEYPLHSPQMDPLAAELVERLVRVDARRATLAMYSTVLSECVDGKELDVRYWGRHLRSKIDFAGSVAAAVHDGYQLFLEVGLDLGITKHVSQCLEAKKADGLAVASLRRDMDERRALLTAAGALYTRGCAVEWARVVPGGGRTVPLPTYPWQRQRFWLDLPEEGAQEKREKIVFVFPGQGSQWLGMGRQLLVVDRAFRESLEACDAAIRREAGFSVLEELAADEGRSRLAEIDVVQPVLFAIEVALAMSWRAQGVVPDCVVGHSMGEVAAAHVAGILSLEDAAKVICRRSRLLRRISGKGAMGLVELSMSEAEATLSGYEDRLGVAVSNGPRSTVLSGEPAALEDVLSRLEKRQVFCRRVKVDVASHSPQVDPLHADLLEALRDVRPSRGAVPMRSTVTGKVVSGLELNAAYWWDNLRKPVLFSQATQSSMKDHQTIFVELSPHPILLQSIQENFDATDVEGIAIPSLRRQSDEHQSMLEGVATVRERLGIAARDADDGPRVEEDLYVVDFRPAPSPSNAQKPQPSTSVWVILSSDESLGAGLSEALRARGAACVLEAAAVARDPGRVERLIAEASAGGRRIEGVVHLGGAGALFDDWRLACEDALATTRTLTKLRSRDSARLILVTRGAQGIGAGAVLPSPLWGLGRTISLEQPELSCTLIDVPAEEQPEMADRLAVELLAADGEDQIALRSDGRYVARLIRGGLDGAKSRAVSIREDASYLVTGALGPLAAAVTQWLISRGARHVALVSAEEPNTAFRERLRGWEELGARVAVVRADVSEPSVLAGVLASIREHGPTLRGVVAIGATAEARPLLETDEKSFVEGIHLGLGGAFSIHRATEDAPLDFFWSCSSMAAGLGQPGLGSAAASDSLLGGLARARASRGLPAVAVSWGPSAIDAALNAAMPAEGLGLGVLKAEEVASFFDRLLGGSAPPALSFGRFSARQWVETHPQAALSPLLSELRREKQRRAAAVGEDMRRTLAEARPENWPKLLEGHLLQQVGRVVRMEPAKIGISVPFKDLGMDSLMGLELKNRLEATLGLELPSTLVFTYATPEALAAHLVARMATSGVPRAPQSVAAEPPRAPLPFAPRPVAEASPAKAPAVSEDEQLFAAFDTLLSRVKRENLR